MNKIILFSLFILVIYLNQAYGHGRMVSPCSRSTLWRYPEFSEHRPEPNYNDHEIYCGGYGYQWDQNNGQCGACGDKIGDPQPRENEGGGKYGRGILAKTYQSGEIINAEIWLTANHMGYFEFHVCPNNNPLTPAPDDCFQPVQLADGSGTQWKIPPPQQPGNFTISLKLPDGLTCNHCVFRWHYHTATRWGECEDGSNANGCGPQENFRNCADIAIL